MEPNAKHAPQDRFRVFISYSHQDLALVKRIVKTLERNQVSAMWDQKFAYGHGFHEQIKSFIAHAHVFLPVITKSSHNRGWVHQEIGYAMALNVPVLPVSIGALPGEMIQSLHALSLTPGGRNVKDELSIEVIANLVNRSRDAGFALYQSAELAEDRALMMTEYAESVIKLGHTGLVRQKGALSSFHIPNKVITDPVWKQRYGSYARSPFHCRLQRQERLALEKHAVASGCRLIVDPSIIYDAYGVAARTVRLSTLVEFLAGMSDTDAQVAVVPAGGNNQESTTIVGDWFAAESVSASIGEGYRQTIFTRHAPSMKSRIDLFDQEFAEHLDRLRWSASSSRGKAIKLLNDLIASINRRPRTRKRPKS